VPATSSGFRGRIASAGTAVALLAAGGLGGFALVSALTGDDEGTGTVQTTVDDDIPPGQDGFPGRPDLDDGVPPGFGFPRTLPDDPSSTTDGEPA